MKTNKVLKWLYGVFMFLPMLAIGVTCAYVTFNKNAKDSYSSQYVETSTNVTNQNQMITDMNYVATYEHKESETTTYGMWIKYKSISIDWSNYGFQQNNYVMFRLFNTGRIQLRTNDDTQYDNGTVWGTTLKQFSFVLNSVYQGFSLNGDVNYTLLTYTQDKLDNAFYYAIGQFNESGFNQIDFVSFFDFLYSDTNIWVTFANTYINYTLFVSLCFFLPSVLLWFINFAYKLMDGFSNKSTRL